MLRSRPREVARDSHFAAIARPLCELSPIDSAESYNRYCCEACRLWDKEFPTGIGKTERFATLLSRLEKSDDDRVIRTAWGAVVIELYEHPRVEKYLVVRKGGYLALEKHKQKDEWLTVREGVGLIMWRLPNEQSLAVNALSEAWSFISNRASNTVSSARKTSSSSSGRSIRKEWTRT